MTLVTFADTCNISRRKHRIYRIHRNHQNYWWPA